MSSSRRRISIGGTNIYTIVVNSTLVFLFLSFAIPIVLGMMAYGTAKWPNPGPWAMGAGLFKLVRAFCRSSAWRSSSTSPCSRRTTGFSGSSSGFLAAGGCSLVRVENRRFQGPPIGDQIAKRAAAIAAAERAVGEKA